MTQVLVYSDPHLGLKRQANFTPTSAAAREDEALRSLKKRLKKAKTRGWVTFCLGDFFDKASNSEETILSTLGIAELTDVILSGNHDIPNNIDKASSLHLLDALTKNVVFADLKAPSFYRFGVNSTDFYFVGHVLTQEDFEQVLSSLLQDEKTNKHDVLCLHCNYGMDKSLMESSLVLERPMASRLLERFDQIWIGHEHTPRSDFDQRLRLVGSWRPTAFDNLEDKQVLIYDTETGETDSETVWSRDEQTYIGPASGVKDLYKEQYFDLTDDLPAGGAQREAIRLLKARAFAVRIRKTQEALIDEAVELKTIELLPALIRKDIATHRPDLLPYFDELKHQD